MTSERKRQAEQVLFSLNPNYISADCCVRCGFSCSMWMAAAVNPDGERKGVCFKCSNGQTTNLAGQSAFTDTLKRIRNGFYD